MPTSAPIANPSWLERHDRLLLAGLLGVSFGLRVWLASTGGQGYWPDEMRYTSSAREAAWQFVHGTSHEAWLALIGSAGHLLFKIFGVPVALWELHFGNNPTLVASWFGFFSVLSIGLIFAIARRAGAGAREGLLAAFFAAAANSLFYYSRHFFPYDLSLFFCLLAAWVAMGSPAWWRSLGAGLAAGLGFLAYNGYWLLGGVVLVFHVLSGGSGRGGRMVRAVLAGAGLLAPLVFAVAAARALDRDLIASFREFSRTITQGDFGRGWILVWDYLWDAEGGLLVIWLALAAGGLWLARGRPARRLMLWLGAAGAIYLGLVVCADVVRAFVVYGRTARMLVPFLCLAAGAGADVLADRWRWRSSWVTLLATTTAFAGWQMTAALRLVFPEDFLKQAAAVAHTAQAEDRGLLRLLNADRLSERQVMSEPRPHVVLLRQPHLLQFRPMLYEGFSEAERRRFLTEDVAMQLVAVPGVPISRGLDGPVQALCMRVRFPMNLAGVSEPLVTGGVPGHANFLYVNYVDSRHVRIGYDVWNGKNLVSPLVAIDYATEHELVLVAGARRAPGETEPGALRLADVFVLIDGKPVLQDQMLSNAVDPRTEFVGLNFCGGSSARTSFTGEISVVRPAGVRLLRGLRADSAWGGYPGAIRLRVALPPGMGGPSVPLLASGKAGAGDLLFLDRDANGVARIGFVHAPEKAVFSEPILPADLRDLIVTMGSCFPETAGHAQWRSRVAVVAGGRVVLQRFGALHPSAPTEILLGASLTGTAQVASVFTGGKISAEPVDVSSVGPLLAQVRVAQLSEDARWRGYPGPLRLRVRFTPKALGISEPLIVSGVAGAGDFIFARHLGDGRVAFGHDHWGVGGTSSAPVVAADGVERELIVSLGSLLPPEPATSASEPREWSVLRHVVLVMLDGKIVLVSRVSAYPSKPGEISVGYNPIGGSSTVADFDGEILALERADTEGLAARVGAGAH